MPSQGPNSPSVSDPGSPAWTNPDGPFSNGGDYASASVAAVTNSGFLELSGFGFSIPENATIDGVEITLRIASSNATWPPFLSTVQFHANSTLIEADNLGPTELEFGATSFHNETLGGASTPYPLGLTTASQFNRSDFTIRLRVVGKSGAPTDYEARIDHVQLTVYYTPFVGKTRLGMYGGPGRRYSFSAKATATRDATTFTRLGLPGAPGPRYSFALKTATRPTGLQFTRLGLPGAPGRRNSFSAKATATRDDTAFSRVSLVGAPGRRYSFTAKSTPTRGSDAFTRLGLHGAPGRRYGFEVKTQSEFPRPDDIIFSRVSLVGAPGRRYSFTAKSTPTRGADLFTRLGLPGAPGRRYSFSAKATATRDDTAFSRVSLVGAPGRRYSFTAKSTPTRGSDVFTCMGLHGAPGPHYTFIAKTVAPIPRPAGPFEFTRLGLHGAPARRWNASLFANRHGGRRYRDVGRLTQLGLHGAPSRRYADNAFADRLSVPIFRLYRMDPAAGGAGGAGGNLHVANIAGDLRTFDLSGYFAEGQWTLGLSRVDQYGTESDVTELVIASDSGGTASTQQAAAEDRRARAAAGGNVLLRWLIHQQIGQALPASFQVAELSDLSTVLATESAGRRGVFGATVGPFTNGSTVRLRIRSVGTGGELGRWLEFPAVVADSASPVTPEIMDLS